MSKPLIIPFQKSPNIRLNVPEDQYQARVFKQISEGLIIDIDNYSDDKIDLEVKVIKTGIPITSAARSDLGYLVLIRPPNNELADFIKCVRSAPHEKFLLLEARQNSISLHYDAHPLECPTMRNAGENIYYPCFLQVEFAYEPRRRFSWTSGFPCNRMLEQLKIKVQD